ncbi:hypothetical protein [Streptacidiphilus jiangxiensis]|uniref:Uncharacterized protein n=1 Tax=Streptacidiphilus jiangxiensis TaxID=235985 RepID=A0A1H8BJZ6_STRJI|nr:hypothetical protein [Streptacidiphilus jiangxiensis]SEM82464.1 hypothetical protein SAMN05414137_1673 [Streptacidiphilus jiangxiensis]
MPSAPLAFHEINRRIRLVPGARHAQPPSLSIHLLTALPIAIWEQRELIPSSPEYERLRREAANMIASHGDDLQFGGRHAAATAASLARGLALLAGAPGGVTFAGVHACLEDHEGCPADS